MSATPTKGERYVCTKEAPWSKDKGNRAEHPERARVRFQFKSPHRPPCSS